MRILVFCLLFLSAVYFSESNSIFKRDAKDDLLKSAENLRNLARKELEKLKAEGKLLLATGLEKVDKLVLDIETQVKNLNPTTEVGKTLLITLEAGLKRAETALEAEIKKLSGSFYDESLKDKLLKQIDNLKKLAADEKAKLKAQGKTISGSGLERAEKFVLDLETQIRNLNPTTEDGKALLVSVEALVEKAATTLKDEIKKLSIDPVKPDRSKEILKDIEFLTEVEVQLQVLHPTTESGKALLEEFEKIIKLGKAALDDDLKKVNGSIVKRDTKDDLLKSAQNLRDLAQKEISKLKAEGKVLLASGLERVDKLVVDIEAQLKSLNPATEVGKALLITLEAGLKHAEDAIEAEIKKLSGSFYDDDDVKERYLNDTEIKNLKELAAYEIVKLKQQGKDLLAAGLERAEKFVLDMETQLKNLNLTTEAGKALFTSVENLLGEALLTLSIEVRVMNRTFSGEILKYDLLHRAQSLKKSIADDIAELKKHSSGLSTAGLERVEESVLGLEAQLKNLNPATEDGKASLASIETLLSKVETTLKTELEKLSIYKTTATVRLVFMESVLEILTKVNVEVETLQKEGKTALVASLQKSIKFFTDVEVLLKNLHPTNDGKQFIKFFEFFVKHGKADLEAYLKKANDIF